MSFIKKMSFITKCALALLTIATFQTHAASVWKVSSGGNTLYLGGTIHVLTAEDYPLPAAYDKAYQAADKVVFETNISAMSSHNYQKKMIDQLSFTDGTTVDQVIDPKTYKALKEYLIDRHIPLEKVATLKPSFLAMTLSITELRSLGFNSEGVDQYYSKKATLDNKAQTWLEGPQEQIDIIKSLGEGNETAILEYSLQDIEDMPESIKALRKNWRDGNMVAMADATITNFKKDYPKIYHALLVNRNKNWLPKIKAMFNDDSTEFVMVGAMHLAGKDGLLAQLQESGYKIERL